ncbi:hypothetical protein [Burkholderia sp. Ax-1719]|uniref:hypothetical protein n=1 Tax=Burkholderia sp. Ax-1719 TaxID=2608334 RepID=UPI001421D20C|nr:hypothetical protein [Burkholderia sp. Ax-1719]NIE67461.1 hypothetical protein [Burkholderia sp. Ax-1719]
MANNRLYILDTETCEYVMVAKGFGNGWSWRRDSDELTEWLNSGENFVRDIGASDLAHQTKLVLVTEYALEEEIEKIRKSQGA